jgi:hypothetical protein
MADALRGKVWVCHITIPLTVQVLTEFVILWERLEQEVQVQLMPMCQTVTSSPGIHVAKPPNIMPS